MCVSYTWQISFVSVYVKKDKGSCIKKEMGQDRRADRQTWSWQAVNSALIQDQFALLDCYIWSSTCSGFHTMPSCSALHHGNIKANRHQIQMSTNRWNLVRTWALLCASPCCLKIFLHSVNDQENAKKLPPRGSLIWFGSGSQEVKRWEWKVASPKPMTWWENVVRVRECKGPHTPLRLKPTSNGSSVYVLRMCEMQ